MFVPFLGTLVFGIAMDGLVENVVEFALKARYERIVADASLVPWTFTIFLLGFIVLLVFVLLVVLYTTLLERKFIGWIQIRLGPNRVGPWGILQPFADMIKLLVKEDIVPRAADKWLHLIAPLVIFIPTMLAFVAIPFAAGTIELPQKYVSPTFESFWVEWMTAEDAAERGLPGHGWLEAEIELVTDENVHRTWWVPDELDHEVVFIQADEDGTPEDNRYRVSFYQGFTHEVKPEVPGGDPVYATYLRMFDFEKTGRDYDVIRVQFENTPGHRGAVELGLVGRNIREMEREYAEIVAGGGHDLEPEERYDFEGKPPKRAIEDLLERFSSSVALNNRSLGAGSMSPAFGAFEGQRVTWRSLNTPNMKYFFAIHGAVDHQEAKANLFFFPGVLTGEDPGPPIEEFDLETTDWRDAGAAFKLQLIHEGGYLIEEPDGTTHALTSPDDSVQLTLGDEPITVSFEEEQYYRLYIMGKDLGIGILYILAVTSLSTLGLFMAGFAANNKWSLYGAIRSIAQLMSYEIPMTLAVLGPIIMSGTLSTVGLVETQKTVVHWFFIPQFIAFFIFLVCMTAEVNRTPFDLPEAESELVAGFHTEYSGLKFGFFFLAEYANMFIAAAVMTVVFFGGWKGPFEFPFLGEFLSSFIWFMLKAWFWLCVFVWFRGTFPRFRIDQMMDYAWKVLLPLALVNIIFTAYLRFSDFDFIIWKENNWRIYEDYIRPLFMNVYTNTYALPAIIIVAVLLITDGIGAYNDARRLKLRRAAAENKK